MDSQGGAGCKVVLCVHLCVWLADATEGCGCRSTLSRLQPPASSFRSDYVFLNSHLPSPGTAWTFGLICLWVLPCASRPEPCPFCLPCMLGLCLGFFCVARSRCNLLSACRSVGFAEFCHSLLGLIDADLPVTVFILPPTPYGKRGALFSAAVLFFLSLKP